MNIASLVLRAHPERLAAVQLAVCAIPGAEVHAVSHDDGRMIVTVEDMLSCADALMKLQQLDHVMSVTLAYEHSES
ncbi:MAG: chaperone NapD [Gallionella sp.]|jgi:nitrate reductase NapD